MLCDALTSPKHPATKSSREEQRRQAPAPLSPARASLRAIGPERTAAAAHEAIGGRAFPRFIERAAHAIRVQLLERCRGELYEAFAAAELPEQAAHLHQGDGRRTRHRAPRSDGRTNLAALLTALVYGMDASSGFIRVPSGNGPAERLAWPVYDYRAYGTPVPQERSLKRTWRHSRWMQAVGILEVRELVEIQNDEYRSLVAHKRFTTEFFRMLGLLKAWRHLRRERERERAEATRQRLGGLAGRAAVPRARRPPPACAVSGVAPGRPEGATGPPSASPVREAAMAEIAMLLGIRKQSE